MDESHATCSRARVGYGFVASLLARLRWRLHPRVRALYAPAHAPHRGDSSPRLRKRVNYASALRPRADQNQRDRGVSRIIVNEPRDPPPSPRSLSIRIDRLGNAILRISEQKETRVSFSPAILLSSTDDYTFALFIVA